MSLLPLYILAYSGTDLCLKNAHCPVASIQGAATLGRHVETGPLEGEQRGPSVLLYPSLIWLVFALPFCTWHLLYRGLLQSYCPLHKNDWRAEYPLQLRLRSVNLCESLQ